MLPNYGEVKLKMQLIYAILIVMIILIAEKSDLHTVTDF